MTRYLGQYGDNVPMTIKCFKFYRTHEKPFSAADVGIDRQKLKILSEKGVLKLVSGGNGRYPNRYIIPTTKETTIMTETIEIRGKKYVIMTRDELDQMLFDANEKGYVSGRMATED